VFAVFLSYLSFLLFDAKHYWVNYSSNPPILQVLFRLESKEVLNFIGCFSKDDDLSPFSMPSLVNFDGSIAKI
jgi:hypothetical protein